VGFWKRLSDIFRVKTNKLLDRVEDPRDTLDLSYEKQIENLQKVRRSVAEVATARKRIELQGKQLRQQADKLQGQARMALGQGREDLAREALARRAALATELQQLQEQHDQVSTQETKLVETAQRIQAQVEAFRTRKETLKATYSAAEAQSRIGEAVAGISDSAFDAGRAMQRAQDKVEQMQARAGAVDELLASGALTDLTSTSDDIQRQLDMASSSAQVEAELAGLRDELASGSPPAAPSIPASSGSGARDPADVRGDSPAPLPSPTPTAHDQR
jgi:phage shock protein A